MKNRLRVAVAQLNLLVGDARTNAEVVISHVRRARDELKAQLVVFPELTLAGYPPEDLLLRPSFMRDIQAALEHVSHEISGIDTILGYPGWHNGALYNIAGLIRDRRIVAEYRKQVLPNYGVFDEKRYFAAGSDPCVVDVQGLKVGITVCEDVWFPLPVRQCAIAGADLIININASPFHRNKTLEREEVVRARVHENGIPIVYANLVGGQDELVFDGESFALDAKGNLAWRAPAFEPGLFALDITPAKPAAIPPGAIAPHLSEEESVYKALVIGVRDYIEKNGFPGAVIGLSGGIDSAVVAAVAVDALGASCVHGVMMPSRYTASMSLEDARTVAGNLGIEYSTISIEPMFEAFLASLSAEFAGTKPGVAEENIQARIRGTLLMAISNKSGRIVLTTGNKSEMAVGYATLYGDMAGGFAAIKDVPKTLVYRLAEYRNRIAPVIPRRIFERAPSAELAPNQKDSDVLPAYPELDGILERYIEQDQSAEEIVAAGFRPEVIARVVAMIHGNEYKRRQAPPGVRITPRAFGRDWRYPITTRFGKG